MKITDLLIVGGLAYLIFGSKQAAAAQEGAISTSPGYTATAQKTLNPEVAAETKTPVDIKTAPITPLEQVTITEKSGGSSSKTTFNVVKTYDAGVKIAGSAVSSGLGINAPGTNAVTTMSKGFAALAAKRGVI